MASALVAGYYGICGGLLSWFLWSYVGTNPYAGDFSWPWLGAGYLLAGLDPYTVHPFMPVKWSPFDVDPLYYPLPAVLAVLPLAVLPAPAAQGIFVAVSLGALAWVVLRRVPVLWPILISAPALSVLANGQWSALLLAGMLSGCSMAGLAYVCKPSVGLALLAARPSLRAAVLAAVTLLLSVAVFPWWLVGWHRNVLQAHHSSILSFWPVLALLGLPVAFGYHSWRWRLFASVLLLPHAPGMYDLLPLLSVARTKRQAALLAGWSWIALVLMLNLLATTKQQTLADVDFRALFALELVGVYLPVFLLLAWQDWRHVVRIDYRSIGSWARRSRRPAS